MGEEDGFADPELAPTEDSEIAAAVDVSKYGTDDVFRPVYINQDDQVFALTISDTKRLLGFLEKSIKFLEEYEKRIIQ